VDAKKNLAIILAGGSGLRFGGTQPKQFYQVGGKTILEHSVFRFENHPAIDGIIVVVHPKYQRKTIEILDPNRFKKIESVIPGGKTRQESSNIGIMSNQMEYENVLIHDSVRPLVSVEIINNLIKKLNEYPAVVPAIPLNDTVIEVTNDNRVAGIPERKVFRKVQTPQAFRFELIKTAHGLARENRVRNAPDDCSLVLRFNLAEVCVIDGIDWNLKITGQIDLDIARKILKKSVK
jgi:2-C-methyl-D-erythritol 4-phosphate cytidylyltransferase